MRIYYQGKPAGLSNLKAKKSILIQTEPTINSDILEKFGKVSYDERNKSFRIEVERDCRVEISRFLFEKGFVVKELHLEGAE